MKKKLALLVIILMISSPSEAKIKGDVIAQVKDVRGYIKISTKFVDDKDTASPVDDEQVGAIDHRLWHPLEFKGKTNAEKRALIQADIDDKVRKNMLFWFQEKYKAIHGEYPVDKARKDSLDAEFTALPTINLTTQSIEEKFKYDSDFDGQCDQEWTIKPDGTHTSVNITPTDCR